VTGCKGFRLRVPTTGAAANWSCECGCSWTDHDADFTVPDAPEKPERAERTDPRDRPERRDAKPDVRKAPRGPPRSSKETSFDRMKEINARLNAEDFTVPTKPSKPARPAKPTSPSGLDDLDAELAAADELMKQHIGFARDARPGLRPLSSARGRPRPPGTDRGGRQPFTAR